MTGIQGFIETYFIDPIKEETGYNVVNTLVFAIIFVGAILLLYEYFFRKKEIKIDREFSKSLLGWIIFGSALRIVRDLKITTTPLLVTPFIYIVVFIISFSTLLAALRLKKTRKIKLMHTWGILGYTLAAITVAIDIVSAESLDITDFLLIYGIWFAWFGIVLAAKKHLAKKFLSNWNITAIMAHLLDAAGTFVALTYAYTGATFENEKHVLGRSIMEYLETNSILLINGSGSWIMFPLKLAVIPLVLWAIDRYSESESENRFLKIVIIILGLGIGIRNSLQVLTLG